MDEGAAVIYKMEKSLRASLHTFAMDSIVSPPDEDHGIDLEAVCILGCNDSTIDFMTATLKDLVEQQRVKDSNFRKLQPPVKVKEDNVNDASNFGDAQYVLLCIDTTKEGGYRQGQIDNLCQAYRRARIIKARTCCSVICDSGRQYPSTDTLCSRYPELKLLAQAQRLITVQRQSAVKFKITQNSLTILKDWLELSNDTSIAGAQATTVKPAPEIENVLPYSDIAQVLTREAIRSMPGVGCICRLTLLSFAGAVALFFTAVFLCSMMADTDLQSDLRVSRSILCEYLENHRTGKSEWGMQYDALVLTSLQLHQSGWIFRNIQNQRSVDRMEIGLLASITRSRSIQPGTTTLTPVRLAHYINGLLSTYQNPRDFHQHDLVTSLELYLLQHAPYSSALSVFDHAILVIALCNAGVVMSYRHVQNIVLQQDDHGAFTLGLDEVAMASMALACVHGDSDVSSALNRSLTYLLSRRSEDGSYGNQYTTSLTLQALNVTESLLGVHEYEQTVSWLKDSLRSELILKNLDVTSHLLIALSGKSLLHVSALTGADKSSKGLSSTQSLSTTYHNDLLSSYDITNQQQQQHMYGCHMNMQGVCLPIHGVGQQKRKRSKKTRVTLNRDQFAVSYGLQWQDLLLNNCAVIPKR